MTSISERGEFIKSVLNEQPQRLIFRKEKESNHRNLSSLIEVLNSLGLMIVPNEKFLTIPKEYGTYRINLLNASVEFTPIICKNCYPRACIYATRKLCIVESSQGWVNFPLLKVDLFILSIVFAIQYDQLPETLLEQIKKFLRCLQQKPEALTLEDRLWQEFRQSLSSIKIEITIFPQAPPIQGPVPPPK